MRFLILSLLLFLSCNPLVKSVQDLREEIKEVLIEVPIKSSLIKMGASLSIADKITPIIYKYSQEYCIPWQDLVLTLKVESNFRPGVFGDSLKQTKQRAVGIAQILPSTALRVSKVLKDSAYHEVKDLFLLDRNIRYASYLLSEEYKFWKSRELAVKAYYLGRGRLRAYRKGKCNLYIIFNTDSHWEKYSKELKKLEGFLGV